MSDTSPPALDEITAATIDHYQASADGFWLGTKDHDVSQNINALLNALEGDGPHRILDFGCGPGRDLMALVELGHHPVGLDGTLAFVEMARRNAGVEVYHQNFLELDLPEAQFDGVFANASLFHVPSSEVVRVLTQLRRSLRSGGVLFSSNPRGDNREGWNGSRYGAYHNEGAWQAFTARAGFEEIDRYYRPAGLPREQQPWLATVLRNPGGDADRR